MRSLLRRLLPAPALELLKRARRILRRSTYQARRMRGDEAVTATAITDALRALGIQPGEDVLLHSSMRGLGVIAGGAGTVIEGVRAAIGEGGTLLAPVYPITTTMVEHLRRGGVALDARNTPSQMGKITETVRLMDGSRRSLHPTHSVAAIGPAAEFYTTGHETSRSPCGPESPFRKLIDRHGWIVALGSTIGKITSYHAVEDTAPDFPVPVYLSEEFTTTVIDAEGRNHAVIARCHDPAVSQRRIDNTREIEAGFETLLTRRGVLERIPLGSGMVWAMRADRLHATLDELQRRGITIYAVPDPARAG